MRTAMQRSCGAYRRPADRSRAHQLSSWASRLFDVPLQRLRICRSDDPSVVVGALEIDPHTPRRVVMYDGEKLLAIRVHGRNLGVARKALTHLEPVVDRLMSVLKDGHGTNRGPWRMEITMDRLELLGSAQVKNQFVTMDL
jgi:hypothetical protein